MSGPDDASRAREIPATAPAPDDGMALSWIGASGIVAIAVLRTVVSFSTDPAFATDPYLDPSPPAALGPAGSMALDVLLILFAAIAFIGEGRSRRKIDWLLIGLALAPAAVIVWHGTRVGGFEHLSRGFSWLAAMIAAVAAAHVARERALRILMAAGLAAVIAPLCVRGIVQVFIEHPEMVDAYERNRAEILAARGIDPASNAARIFEERLYQSEATAWFGLANVFGSVVVAGLIVWSGWLIAAVVGGRARLESGFSGVLGLAAILAATGLILAGAKGAFAAALVGLMLLAAPFFIHNQSKRDAHGSQSVGVPIHSVVALGAVALAIMGVIVRGTLLPESFAGDRSILFRWHYWIGSCGMFADAPLTGVGAGGFQDAFVLHRLPTTPEEAASAHNLFIDWLATLGVSGFFWIALVAMFLWRAAGFLRSDRTEVARAEVMVRESATTTFLALIALGAFVPALLIEQPALDSRSVFFRAIGVMGYLALAAIGAKAIRRSEGWLTWWSIAAAAIALVIHAQIEVTLIQPGAAAWGFVLLGVAGARSDVAAESVSGRSAVWFGRGLILAVLAFSIVFLVPVVRQARSIDRAANRLREIGMVRLLLENVATARDADQRQSALRSLLSAVREADMGRDVVAAVEAAQDGSPQSLARALVLLEPETEWRLRIERSGAWQELWNAFVILESNPRLLRQSIEQLLIADMIRPADPAETYLSATANRVDHLLEVDPSPAAVALAARVHERCADLTGDARHIEQAIELRRRLTELDPHGLAPRVALADLLARCGRTDEAREEYGRALEQSEQWYLDEFRQLTDEERNRIETFIINNPIDILKNTTNN